VGATGVESSPTAAGESKEFTFTTALATIEAFDALAEQLKRRDGVLGVSGSERNITVKWDPAKLNEQRVRELLASLGNAVR
jgi:allophanate hydrolase subunit 1